MFILSIITKQTETDRPLGFPEICKFQNYYVMQGQYFLHLVPLWAMTSKCETMRFESELENVQKKKTPHSIIVCENVICSLTVTPWGHKLPD